MLIKIQKGLLRLILLMVFIAFLLSLPSFAEAALERSLDIKKWRSDFTQRVNQNSSLHLSIQGVYLSLFEGIVLKGVHIEDQEGSYRFYAEDLHVRLAFLPLLQGHLEKQSLHAVGAKLQLSSFNFAAIQKIKTSLLALRMQFEGGEEKLDVPVFLSGLQLIPFKKQSDAFSTPFDLELSLQNIGSSASRTQKGQEGKTKEIKETEEIEVRMYRSRYRETIEEAKKGADWEIEMSQKSGEDMQIELHKVPVKILTLFLQYYNWKEGISFLKNDFQLREGLFSGEGIFRTEPTGKAEKKELSLVMNYRDLNLSMHAGFLPPFHLHNAKGKLKLHLSKSVFDRDRDGNEKREGDTAFQLKIEQPGLVLEFGKAAAHKLQGAEEREAPYRLKGNLSFEPRLGRGGVRMGGARGKLSFALSLHKAASYVYPLGQVQGKDLRLPFLDSQNKTHAELDPSADVFIKKIILYKKTKEDKIKMSGLAYILGSKLKLSGQSDLRFLPSADEFRWESDWDIKLDLKRLSLASFLEGVRDSNRLIQRKGRGIQIRRYLGVEKNEFMKSALYRNFLSGLRLKAQITLHDIKAATPIPRQLHFKASANSNHFRLELIPIKDNENFWADFRYALYFQGSLPKHDIDLRLSLKKNNNPLPLLTSTQFPPKTLDVEYRYDGYGLVSADMLRRSYSYLQVRAENLKLADKQILRAIAHSSGVKIKTKSPLFLDTFSIRKATSGIEVKLYFNGQSPELRLNGSGLYSLGLGGNLQCSVQKKEAGKRNSKMRILASGQWVPEIK